jgi:hypothetical protein
MGAMPGQFGMMAPPGFGSYQQPQSMFNPAMSSQTMMPPPYGQSFDMP